MTMIVPAVVAAFASIGVLCVVASFILVRRPVPKKIRPTSDWKTSSTEDDVAHLSGRLPYRSRFFR